MTFMDIYVNVFFDFFLQKSLAGTLPATLAPFADRFTRQTADLANARMRPFCAVQLHWIKHLNTPSQGSDTEINLIIEKKYKNSGQ